MTVSDWRLTVVVVCALTRVGVTGVAARGAVLTRLGIAVISQLARDTCDDTKLEAATPTSTLHFSLPLAYIAFTADFSTGVLTDT